MSPNTYRKWIDHRILGAWINHPSIDYVLALMTAALSSGLRHFLNWHPLYALDPDGRRVWLQTIAGVTAALLGLALTAIAVVFAITLGPRLIEVMSTVGSRLIHLLASGLFGLTIATVAFLVILPLAGSPWLVFTIVGFGAFSMLRFARILWVFLQILHVAVSEATDSVELD